MPEYLAPGVYVEEIETGPRPIEGVSTSTTGFVGQTERGPLVPRMVSSWEEYSRWFGGYIDRLPGGTTRKYLPYAVRGFFDNQGQRLIIARIVPPGAAAATLSLGGTPGATEVSAVGPGLWGNNIMVRIKPAALALANSPTANWFRMTLLYYRDGIPNPFVDPTDPANSSRVANAVIVAEDYDNLSVLSSDSNFAQTIVNAASKLVTLTVGGRPAEVAFERLSQGTAGNGEPTEEEYRGSPDDRIDQRKGLLGLAGIRDISLLAIPDEVVLPNLRSDIIQQCETLKDRFAILCASEAEQDGSLTTLRTPQDSTYGAYYLPWVRVLATQTPEGNVLVPPHGHLAGIYARVDDERGVHKAPANEVVAGIITRDLSIDKKPLKLTLGKQDQDILNPLGVNVIRDFRPDGRGIRVWGARTMTSDPMWRYINVRRLFIFIEQSIDRGTQWIVFEPNYEQTWSAVRMSISAFLTSVWRSGALAGTTPDEAFFVKCDRTTMLQDDLDNGKLICLIGVAPVKPAEFVIFRISQKTLDAAQA
jgi:phage tail sheath protein FI